MVSGDRDIYVAHLKDGSFRKMYEDRKYYSWIMPSDVSPETLEDVFCDVQMKFATTNALDDFRASLSSTRPLVDDYPFKKYFFVSFQRTVLTRWVKDRYHRRSLSIDMVLDPNDADYSMSSIIANGDNADQYDPVKMAELRERREAVIAVLDTLDPIHREVLQLHMTGESMRNIAETIGIPVGTVKSRLFAARANFREEYSGTS